MAARIPIVERQVSQRITRWMFAKSWVLLLGKTSAAPGESLDYARPALSDERVQHNAAGHVGLKRKIPWHDCTST